MGSDNTRVGSFEFIGLAIAAAVFLSGVITCFEVLLTARGCAPLDILIALGLTTIPAIPTALLLSIVSAGVLRFFTKARDRRTWVPVITVSTAILSICSVVAFLIWDGRLGTAILAGLSLVPATLAVCGLTARIDWMLRPWRAIGSLLGIAAALVLIACVLTGTGVQLSVSLILLGLLMCVCASAMPPESYRWFKRTASGCSVILLVTLGAVYVAWTVEPAAAPAATVRNDSDLPPNVVLIVLDTTRRDHIGVYGREPSPTPGLDAFAAASTIYDEAFSTAPWTIPAHASMFTGLYAVSHGSSNAHHLWLDDEFTTLAEMLQSGGYQTVAWNSNPYLERCNQLQGFDSRTFLRGPYEDLSVHRVALALGLPERWVDKGAAEALTVSRRWLADEYDSSKPLFVFLNLYETHRHYIPPYSERHTLASEEAGLLKTVVHGLNFNPLVHEIKRTEDPAQQAITRRLYEAEVRYQDRRFAEWLDVLAARIDLDNTLVIITSDHGENLGEHGRWEHLHEINDTLIHVPLIIRYPNGEAKGQRVGGMCQIVDLVATVFDVLEREPPSDGLAGRTLRPRSFEPRPFAVADVAPYYMHFPMIKSTLGFEADIARFNRHRRVLRTDTMKYIWSSDGGHELFDMTRDPGETRNLIEEQGDTARELHDRLMAWWDRRPKYTPPAAAEGRERGEPLDEEALRQLRGLGYIGG